LSDQLVSSTDRTERRLLIVAGVFLAVFSLTLTLSNAARLRSWQVDYRWSHWLGLVVWGVIAWLAHRQLSRQLPERDPYIFPVAMLLTGWGILTIWRLSDSYGIRQATWLLLIGMLFVLALHYDTLVTGGRILAYLRRFKYIWLTSGLVLTAATLFLGTNPLGTGPRLWLGCCGIYFQPSEPLKLLLVVFLAAYLADRQSSPTPPTRLMPLLTPTLVLTGITLLLLVFQRDLGTAMIFIALYAVIIFSGTGNKKVFLVGLLVLAIASVAGYLLFNVVSQRVDAWINPWLDPAGGSYQIVQSLLAVANGGFFGRGIGMGSPSLVPIAQSDFIFSAISEETGLLGGLAILALLAVLVSRGMRLALRSADTFQRLLAIGLVMHLVGQSLLIIAGNLRLLPLTGVTLPFVSSGGSSLLVSFIELLCLMLISARQVQAPVFQPAQLKAQTGLNQFLSIGMMAGLLVCAMGVGWWSLVRAPALLSRTDNPRRTIADRYVQRGTIFDSRGNVLAESTGQSGNFTRVYPYPALGPLLGYTDQVYGQAGLEASLDPYLRGLQGYPSLTMWWENLLYGQPPPGLDVRLSLDLDLQSTADQLLEGHQGAAVLLNAATGEVLAFASSPTFDANQLGDLWDQLVNDPSAPLFDRAAMGLYPTGNALGVFLLAASQQDAAGLKYDADLSTCSVIPSGHSWAELVAAGCSDLVKQLANSMSDQQLVNLLDGLGFYSPPTFPVETLSSNLPESIPQEYTYLAGSATSTIEQDMLKVTPLQMALAVAALTNAGQRPVPRLAVSVDTPQAGWVMLPAGQDAQQILNILQVKNVVQAMQVGNLPNWQSVSSWNNPSGSALEDSDSPTGFSWFLGGTSPDWKGVPIALAILLEENNPDLATEIGQRLFQQAMYP
jgi:cell division protein FtsW (lipid II flippase)